MYKNFFKRVFDFFAALIGIIILCQIILIVSILLFISNKGNPFFVQKRPGKNEKIFSLIKFRSMNNKVDANGELLPDHLRLTKTGIFIRKTSLDEIPQLINVLKGDMSFVGPRPLLVRYLPYYNSEEKIRDLVRPGITGLAQISGRNFISWEDKFLLDKKYVENLSFLQDCNIFIKTFLKVFDTSSVAVDEKDIDEYFDVYRKRQLEKRNA